MKPLVLSLFVTGFSLVYALPTSHAQQQLGGFEVSDGYPTWSDLSSVPGWSKTAGDSGNIRAVPFNGGVIDRFGTQIGQIADVYSNGSSITTAYAYDFGTADFGVDPATVTDADITFSIWFCPDTNGQAENDTSPYHTMTFYDNNANSLLELGTGNAVTSNELALWTLSGSDSDYQLFGGTTANAMAWNRWDVTFHLSSTLADSVSVALTRGYDLSPGTPQSTDPAVTVLDRAALRTDVATNSLATWEIASESGNDKYYYDDSGFSVVPEPSAALLLTVAGLLAISRRRR